MPDKFMLESFQYSLTGRLAHGIVHNLNGPLQIISMQMEMMKMDLMKCRGLLKDSGSDAHSCGEAGDISVFLDEIDKMNERMEQAAEVVARLDSMIQILGYRGEEDQGGEYSKPVDMLPFVREFIEFWNSDLYFKHRVEKIIRMPDASVFVMMDETPVLAMLDGIMSGFLGCIKAREGSSFGMTLISGKDRGCRIELEHTGLPVSDEICDRIMAFRESYMRDRGIPCLDYNVIKENPELIMALLLGAVRSVDAGWSFELASDRAVVAPV